MNIQEAYIQGLNDAENRVIENLMKTLLEDNPEPFPNPELEKVRKVIALRSDYYRRLAAKNNNVGIGFRKRVREEHEILGVDVPPPAAVVKNKVKNIEKRDKRGRNIDKLMNND